MVTVKTSPGIFGFTLLELLVVMAIIALLTVLTLPAISNISKGTSMTRAGQVVADQFVLARQEATGKNRDIQVRFVWKDDAPSGYKGIQLWAASAYDVTDYRPITRITWIPDGMLMSSQPVLSPLLASPTIVETNGVFPGRGNTKYCGFRFRSGGGTDLNFNSASNFITIVNEKDAAAGTAPANYAVIQVDPVNGRSHTYRP
ncbi:hypothetical protein BH09VER1_BH09VER1_42920 [soil metagenome]